MVSIRNFFGKGAMISAMARTRRLAPPRITERVGAAASGRPLLELSEPALTRARPVVKATKARRGRKAAKPKAISGDLFAHFGVEIASPGEAARAEARAKSRSTKRLGAPVKVTNCSGCGWRKAETQPCPVCDQLDLPGT